MTALNARSISRLAGVHPDLVKVITSAAERYEAATGCNVEITEGLRTEARQRQLLERGATKTLNSRHLTGHAVDVHFLADGEARWDWPLFDKFAIYVKAAANALAVPIVWGGDWKTFRDGPHFELNRKDYP